MPMFFACLTTVLVAQLGKPEWIGPAFLDSKDRITVWVPQACRSEELENKTQVSIGGKPAAITSIRGRERSAASLPPDSVTLPGSFQSQFGDPDWSPSGTSTLMVPVKTNVFRLAVPLRAGRYEFKVAVGGSWAKNYGAEFERGGPNISIRVPTDQLVGFVVDFSQKTVRNSIEHPQSVPRPTERTPAPQASNLFQSFEVRLSTPVTSTQLRQPISIQIANSPTRKVFCRGVLDAPEYRYEGADLGPTYTKAKTTFRVWSPVSRSVSLLLYRSSTETVMRIPMRSGPRGVWSTVLEGDRHGQSYAYEFDSYGEKRVAADIYAKAASADSSRSLVVDLARTNPPNWPAPRPFAKPHQSQAVIYEAHIRDLTAHPSSNVRAAWRGKYLGLTESGPNMPLSHIQRLGVTHVHLLPFQNFNPSNSKTYNWGYETTLFNVPEEQYSTKPNDPLVTIRETKAMIRAVQAAGIGVVLDVVYNHSVPSAGPGSAFWESAPYFWFRTNDRGDVLNESGVGNALHDERPMVRKFIRESLQYWAREYRLDGFRFDLIGMFTRESNQEFARAIRAVNPSAIIYGEPWTGGGPNRFPKGAQRGTGIGVFNDDFRNFFRGGLDDARPGFISYQPADAASFRELMAGSIGGFAAAPTESVNYVSAHDNLTLWDKVTRTMASASFAEHTSAVKLAQAAVLLSAGVPFLEGGVEIGRTKKGIENSYNQGDAINQFRWDLAARHKAVADQLKVLIAVRKRNAGLMGSTTGEVRRAMRWLDHPVLHAYRLRNPDGSGLIAAFNNSREAQTLRLPANGWRDAFTGRMLNAQVQVAPLTVAVLEQRN
jgi:pullulanase